MKEFIKLKLNYSFKNIKLLKEAFTHPSFSMENKLTYSNQRLEFLGDAVIELIVSKFLMNNLPKEQEGKLTKLRAVLVKKESLALIAKELNLNKFLKLSKGEIKADGGNQPSALCDLFEAIAGAMFLDSDYDTTEKYILPLFIRFFPKPEELLIETNPKGELQEITIKELNAIPVYNVINSSGPSHSPIFTVQVQINDKILATAEGNSKKVAEKNAAIIALKEMK
jgi:ribonuclease-3